MKKMYVTPVVNVINIQTIEFLAESTSSYDHADSKKFGGNKFGSEGSFQNDGSFGGQKSPWEGND